MLPRPHGASSVPSLSPADALTVFPALAVAAYVGLVWLMHRQDVEDAPFIELFFVFAAYGFTALWGITGMTAYSGMHLLTLPLLFAAFAKMLMQGEVLRRRPSRSAYHTAVMAASYGFVGLIAFAPVLGGLVVLVWAHFAAV